MASTSFIPNQITNTNTNTNTNTRDSSKRRKRKKFQKHNNNKSCDINHQSNQNIYPSWKSETQHQIYSSKLLQALRQVRATRSNDKHPNQGRAIREAADRMLAVTAKGRTRWSRAILKNKLKLKCIKRNKRQRGLIATTATTGNSRLKKPKLSILRLKTKNLPSIQRKARVLGGLVPGCKKQSLPVVLEEATDYIPALEMQVKAMAALVELLSGGSTSTVAAAGAGAGFLGHLSLNRPSPNS